MPGWRQGRPGHSHFTLTLLVLFSVIVVGGDTSRVCYFSEMEKFRMQQEEMEWKPRASKIVHV